MLRVWNVSLICATFALSLLGTFLVRSGVLQSIHAFGESKVGPPLLVLIGDRRDRLDDPDRLPPRLAALRAPARLAVQPRVGLPGQQPAAGRDGRRGRLGHLLPADLRGGDRRGVVARLALVQPLRDPARDRARLLHGHRAAGRLAADDPRRACGCGRRSRWRRPPSAAVARADDRRSPRARPPTRSSSAAPSRSSRSSRRSSAAPGPAARSPAAGGSAALGALADPQPPPLRRLHRPHRPRPGAVRDRRLLQLPDEPGPAARARAEAPRSATTRSPTSEPTSERSTARRSRSSPSGRCSTSPATASRSRPCIRRASTTRARPPIPAAPIRSFFEGEATSEVGRKEGLTRDLWSAMQPDLSSFDAVIEQGRRPLRRRFAAASPASSRSPRSQAGWPSSRARRSAASPTAT